MTIRHTIRLIHPARRARAFRSLMPAVDIAALDAGELVVAAVRAGFADGAGEEAG
jgi:hypothetical protein